jgi:hypothetical protein
MPARPRATTTSSAVMRQLAGIARRLGGAATSGVATSRVAADETAAESVFVALGTAARSIGADGACTRVVGDALPHADAARSAPTSARTPENIGTRLEIAGDMRAIRPRTMRRVEAARFGSMRGTLRA